jgi:hypothetical protein
MFNVLVATSLVDKEVEANAKDFWLGVSSQVGLSPVDTERFKNIPTDYDEVIITIS